MVQGLPWTMTVPGKKSGRYSSIYSAFMIVKVTPQGDRGILANPVILKRPGKVISGLKGIYDMKRSITEVRFDDQFEPSITSTFRIPIRM